MSKLSATYNQSVRQFIQTLCAEAYVAANEFLLRVGAEMMNAGTGFDTRLVLNPASSRTPLTTRRRTGTEGCRRRVPRFFGLRPGPSSSSRPRSGWFRRVKQRDDDGRGD